jgi:3-oxoacyl-[acyl-carrier-protein] synthase-3
MEPQALIHVTALPQGANVGDPQAYERTRDVKHLMDFPAGRLQSELGWHDAAVLGLTQQACTGLLGGWRVAGALLAAESDWQQVVVISADRFPEGARYEQAYHPISDAATCGLVSRTPSPGAFRLRAVHQVTNGAMSLADDTRTAGSFFPWMHRTITATLERAGITGDDLFAIVPQNTHRATWQVLSSLLGWKVPVHEATRAGLGHLISGDGVANLCHLATTTDVPPGALLLLPAAGYGATWQCALLEAGPR